MNKRKLKGVLIFVLISSLSLNLLAFISVFPQYVTEESRLKEINFTFDLFRYSSQVVNQNNKELFGSETVQKDGFVSASDIILKNLNLIGSELISASGGASPESGKIINPQGGYYVNKYFYGENHFRPKAINFFDQSIIDYLNHLKTLNIESNLVLIIDTHQRLNMSPWFKDLTVNESLVLLNLISNHVLFDRYQYIIKMNDKQK